MSRSAARAIRGKGVPEKRDAILEAAARLFATHGFERTTTRMIARDAGVAEGTIYIYFQSKRDMLLAFLDREVFRSVKDIFRNADTMSDEEVIHRFLLDRFRLWQSRGGFLKAVLAQAFFDRDLAEGFFSAVIGPASEMVKDYIARRISEGRFRHVDPLIAARSLAGTFFVTALLFQMLPYELEMDLPPEEYLEKTADVFLNGVRIRGEEATE